MRLGVLSLASLSGLGIWRCHELCCRSQTRLGSHVTLLWLWLWCRLAAVAPVGPLGWEPPYAAGAVLEKTEKRKKKKKELVYRSSVRFQAQSLALLSGLRIQRHCELWCGLQTRLGPDVAVALA